MLYDKDIRNPLFEYLEEHFGKVRILEETVIGASRADVVMILDGLVFGIEIKSDADTYARLNRQVCDYDKFFDQNYVVVGSTHAEHVKDHVPDYWGIITVELMEDKVDFYILREPKTNLNMDMAKKLSLLWRPELAHIQELNNMHAYKQKSKQFVREKILDNVSKDVLQIQISQELFERDYTTIFEKINEFRKENNQRPRRRTKRRRRRK